jgi:trans-2,3-dihydro-3-hydroxyanthranilate isomerase
MFGPALGVAEDPATGSAAGPLAVHLGRHGVVPYGTAIEIHQGTEIGRPSALHARAHGPDKADVGGRAVVVAQGHYRVQ